MERVEGTVVEDQPVLVPAAACPGPPLPLGAGPLGDVQALDREIGRLTALRARALAEFAATRPSSADRQPGEPGSASAASRAARPAALDPVSEWAAQEVSLALSVTQRAAQTLLEQSVVLVEQLPATLDALESGALNTAHVRALVDTVAPIGRPGVRAAVERDLLGWMAGRVATAPQLRERARRVVLRRDAEASARRLERAVRDRSVFITPGRVEGTAELTAVLTVPEARACLAVLHARADALADDGGAPRTRAQKAADALCDILLRAGEGAAPAVQAQLIVVASVETLAGGDQPGEVDGETVPAEVVRHLARALGLVPDQELDGHGPARRSSPGSCDDLRASAGPPTPTPSAGPPTPPALTGAPSPTPSAGPPDAPPPRPVYDEPAASAEDWRFLEGLWALDAAVPAQHDDDAWAAADELVVEAADLVERARRAVAVASCHVATAEDVDDDAERTWQQSSAAAVTHARTSIAALAAASVAQRAAIAELLSRTGGGGLADRPRVAVVDALSGTLLALTDATELRRLARCERPGRARAEAACTHSLTDRAGLAPPSETDGYRPSAALDRFVRARDRRCRFPGCRFRVPRGGELDHDTPYPLGPTAARNLVGYCTRHHRGKHQAPGWLHSLHPDGRLTVTTPSDLTVTTEPPPF